MLARIGSEQMASGCGLMREFVLTLVVKLNLVHICFLRS